ncbi:MAG: EAL domain-containing protein [Solirubrobacteraceae bacterium]
MTSASQAEGSARARGLPGGAAPPGLGERVVSDSTDAQTLLDSMSAPTAIVDADGLVVQVNRAWREDPVCAVCAYGTPYGSTGGPGPEVLAPLLDGAEQTVLADVRDDRSGRWLQVQASRISTGGAMVSHVDVTDARAAVVDLALRASNDPLTGLSNRRAFLERLRDAMDHGYRVAVIFLDLDHFKLVNDTGGHHHGDALLQHVAERIGAAVRPSDVVARLGGDEFAVLCIEIDEHAALAVAERIRAAMVPAVTIGDQERHVTVSVGCRTWAAQDGAHNEHDLVRDADAAMYQAKAGGRNRVHVFSDETRQQVLRRVELEDQLRKALGSGVIRPHYQPIVDLRSGRVVGAEALLRWPGGPGPDEFVPVAEETGLIVALGSTVVEDACAQLARWTAEGLDDLTVTINVSPRQIGDPTFVEHLVSCIDRHGVAPARLCLELTESAFQAPDAARLAALDEVTALGAYLAIDDFGTGFSSLSQLKRLPVEALKIDRGFVDGLGSDPDDSAIVASILSLARAMGLHVVAEGVETAAQASELLALGCVTGQGWLYAKAMPAEELAAHARALLADPPADIEPATAPARTQAEASLVAEALFQLGVEAAT